jgi:3-oxoacyl-[acyl-carrier protein] reductase
MNLNLKGKTAVVCGSTQGIGYAAALEIAMLGANVVLVARNEEKLQSTLNTLDTTFGQQHAYLLQTMWHTY